MTKMERDWKAAAPWQGVGEHVKAKENISDWVKRNGLDWEVEKRQLIYTGSDASGLLINAPNKFALVRKDNSKYLTTCGPTWQPNQNAKMFGELQEFAQQGGIPLVTAGTMKDDGIVWGLAELPVSYEVGKGDKVKGFLLLTSSHLVGRSNTLDAVSVRIFCQNQMPAIRDAMKTGAVKSLKGASSKGYRQTHMAEFDFAKAVEVIGNSVETIRLMEKRNKAIAKLKLSLDDAINKILLPVYAPNWIEKMKENYSEQKFKFSLAEHGHELPKPLREIVAANASAPGAIEGTGWGLLNAVTYHADHMQGRNTGTRLFRSWLGDYKQKKIKVENALYEMAS